jgi:hypothetical protein
MLGLLDTPNAGSGIPQSAPGHDRRGHTTDHRSPRNSNGIGCHYRASYLLQRLEQEGVQHVFGVPGDYVLRFYQVLSESPLTRIGTTREDTAAFAADAYARVHGLGAVAVTYGVGALNVVNANAKSSPVVVISGAPGLKQQLEDPLIHHRFGPADCCRCWGFPFDYGRRADRQLPP